VKSLGPANDAIPAEEMLLAEALQSAKARGLKATTKTYYRDARGWATPASKVDAGGDVAACCAVGAIRLDDKKSELLAGIAMGNDSDESSCGHLWEHELAGWTLGAAFQEAMSEG
jgi:hypothetical protein